MESEEEGRWLSLITGAMNSRPARSPRCISMDNRIGVRRFEAGKRVAAVGSVDAFCRSYT